MTSWESALHPLFWHPFGYGDRIAIISSNESRLMQQMCYWYHDKNTKNRLPDFNFFTPSLNISQQKTFGTKNQIIFQLCFNFQTKKIYLTGCCRHWPNVGLNSELIIPEWDNTCDIICLLQTRPYREDMKEFKIHLG
jgi:hypothetical protein